jgi:putative nucleotidyltransferase with HDIG domain
VLLDTGDPPAAAAVADRVREAVAALGSRAGASTGVAARPQDAADAEQLVAIADARLYECKRAHGDRGSRGAALDSVIALAAALDLRDPSTAAHSRTVAQYAALTGTALGLPPARLQRLRLAGLLHDLGKIAVPDAVLHKPGALTDEEWALMRSHPEVGAQLCASAGLPDVAAWVRAHHERADGRGYPNGLRAEEIPLESAVLAVADAYEAMTADRPYRAAIPAEQAREKLRRCAGSQFDPRVVEAFLTATELAYAVGEMSLSQPSRTIVAEPLKAATTQPPPPAAEPPRAEPAPPAPAEPVVER